MSVPDMAVDCCPVCFVMFVQSLTKQLPNANQLI